MSNLVTLDQAQTARLDQNPVLTYLGGLRDSGKRSMLAALNTIAADYMGEVKSYDLQGKEVTALFAPWGDLRYQHTQAIKQRLLERGYKYTTVNKHLSALRRVLKECWLLGQMSAEDYHKAAAVKAVKGSSEPAGRDLSIAEFGAVMKACYTDPSPAGYRDAAILAVLYSCGLRRAEVVGLDLEDLNHEDGSLLVRHGKGNKERTAYLRNGGLKALQDWLKVRGDQPGALFNPINKGGHIQARRMTTQAIYNMLDKRADQAGISDFSPHDMRRTFITHQLEAGTGIEVVSSMAGHANIQTTMRYDRRDEKVKQQAAGRLHVPYNRQEVSQ